MSTEIPNGADTVDIQDSDYLLHKTLSPVFFLLSPSVLASKEVCGSLYPLWANCIRAPSPLLRGWLHIWLR